MIRGPVLHPPPDRRDRHRDPDRPTRCGHRHRTVDRTVSVPRPAQHPRDRDVPGRLRRGRRAVGGDAHRAGGQRGGPADLHEVVEHQRRTHAARCQFRGRDGPGHRERPHPEPRVGGAGAPAAGSHPAGRHRQEAEPEHPDGDLDLLAHGLLRRQLPDQLCRDQPARPAAAHSRDCAGGSLRRDGLRDADLVPARQAGEARPHPSGRHQRHQGTEPAGPRRQGRGRAHAQGPGIHEYGQRPGPAGDAGGVRRDHRPADRDRRRGPDQGHRPCRARLAGLQRLRAAERQARRRDGGVPAAWCEPAQGRRDDLRDDGAGEGALPVRDGLQDRLRHHAGGAGVDPRDPEDVRRGAHPGDARRLHLPAEHPRDDHPAGDDSGLPDRDVHLLPGPGILGQHALDVRPGARYRHRGGRRHRRRRGGHPPSRARDEPEGGDDQGDGGSHGPGHRHRPHSLRGVRPGRHARRSGGQHVQAVRAYDRDLGAAVGVQRAVADPCAVRDAPQAAKADAGTAGRILPGLQQGVRRHDDRLRGRVAPARAPIAPHDRDRRCGGDRGQPVRTRAPGGVHSGRGPGHLRRQRPAPTRRLARAHQRAAARRSKTSWPRRMGSTPSRPWAATER